MTPLQVHEVELDCFPDIYFKDLCTDKLYLKTWKAVPDVFSQWELNIQSGPVVFMADWREVANNCIREHIQARHFWKSTAREKCNALIEQQERRNLSSPKLKVTIKCPNNEIAKMASLLNIYLMNVFLALNLSEPGSSAMRSKINLNGLYLEGLNLDSFFWSCLTGNWPPVKHVPLINVKNWLTKTGLGEEFIAKTALQRALMALLYVSDGEISGPPHMLWLCHALEAILDSPVEKITKTMWQRIFVLLGEPGDKKVSKKSFNEFYNIRSRVMHGEYEIIHPAMDEFNDPKVENKWSEFRECTEFGMSVLVAILQKCIRKNWMEIKFIEKVTGMPGSTHLISKR